MDIKSRLQELEDEYFETRKFKIHCGTFNVNCRTFVKTSDENTSLASWLLRVEQPDIYAIGLQEVDTNPRAFIVDDDTKVNEWDSFILDKHLNSEKLIYQRVCRVRLVGIVLFVYVKEEYLSDISDICKCAVPTGALGIFGNKGAVSIRFKIFESSLCFINCHFNAHDNETTRRNEDFENISKGINFASNESTFTLEDHDVVFWIGDFNYRIEKDYDFVKMHLSDNLWHNLLLYDQLTMEKNKGNVFQSCEEADINFRPTYKFDVGSDVYDSSDKLRKPAWTDRILYNSKRKNIISVMCYVSVDDIRMSDHRPVYALFSVTVKVSKNMEKFRKLLDTLSRENDMLQNKLIPQVRLIPTDVHFENVRYFEKPTAVLILENCGNALARCKMTKNSNVHMSECIYIKPARSFDLHCGHSKDLEISFTIKPEFAGIFNASQKYKEIIVLSARGIQNELHGPDLFITVDISTIPSVFGMSAKELCSRKPLYKPENYRGAVYSPDIFAIIDSLMCKPEEFSELFMEEASTRDLCILRAILDNQTYEELSRCSSITLSSGLLHLLQCLSGPLIPRSTYEKCVKNSSNLVSCVAIVMQEFPTENRCIFLYIVQFLYACYCDLKTLRNNAFSLNDWKFQVTRIFGNVLMQRYENKFSEQRSAFMSLFLTKKLDSFITANKI